MKKLAIANCLLFCLLSIGFVMTSFASLPDMESERYGVGVVAQQYFTQSNVLSLRYWANKDWGIEGLLGYYSYANSINGSLIGGRYLRSIKRERYLNLYGFGMLAIVNTSQVSPTNSNNTESVGGTCIALGLGAEFFIEELPNLGVSFEAGLADMTGDYYNNASTKGIALFGNPVSNVALHYYFK